VIAPVPDTRDTDTGGPYPAEWQAIRRAEALKSLGIFTGVRKCPMGWTLVHDIQGTISALRHERRIP
jgi:hypothetical protein